MSAVLETNALVKKFGGITATNAVTFALEKGARHALIGPNGAGKTTFINLLTGVLEPTSGRISLDGKDITNVKPEARVKMGLVRTFQINQLFAGMTPLQALGVAVSERQARQRLVARRRHESDRHRRNRRSRRTFPADRRVGGAHR